MTPTTQTGTGEEGARLAWEIGAGTSTTTGTDTTAGTDTGGGRSRRSGGADPW